MSEIRILHCGNSIENYIICADQRVAGFTKRTANSGDMVYLVVKVKGKSYCGARGLLGELTDKKPWENGEIYVQTFNFENIEYCDPFNISVLSEIGGKHWSLKYVQSSKSIKDTDAIQKLECEFNKKYLEKLHKF